jgi:hypothetical protein
VWTHVAQRSGQRDDAVSLMIASTTLHSISSLASAHLLTRASRIVGETVLTTQGFPSPKLLVDWLLFHLLILAVNLTHNK